MNRRLSQLALALAAMLVLAACGPNASPTAPPMLFNDQSLSGEAKLPNIDICHLNDEGGYNLININGNAQQSHLNHGDIFPTVLDDGSLVCAGGCNVTLSDASGTVVLLGGDLTLNWTASGEKGAVTYVIFGIGTDDLGNERRTEVDRFTGTGDDTFSRFYPGGFPFNEYVIVVECPEGTAVDEVSVTPDPILS